MALFFYFNHITCYGIGQCHEADMKAIDRILAYTDVRFPMGSDCACRLRVWQLKDGRNVVMATELEPSPGASVTNTAETWATEACREYNLDPRKTIFIENYDRRISNADPSFPAETFDFVSFDWKDGVASGPRWKPGGRISVEALIKEDLP